MADVDNLNRVTRLVLPSGRPSPASTVSTALVCKCGFFSLPSSSPDGGDGALETGTHLAFLWLTLL
jgi:hypothetical protein